MDGIKRGFNWEKEDEQLLNLRIMMKIRSLMYVLMGTFTIVACTNSDNEATTGDSPTDKISTGFDWATSRTVSVSITSANKTLVSLYSDAECKIPLLENALVEGETTVDLNIPMHSQAVYAKYTAMSGSQVRTINLKGCTIVYSLCTFLHFIHSKKE